MTTEQAEIFIRLPEVKRRVGMKIGILTGMFVQ
jgi:hypothetical protein